MKSTPRSFLQIFNEVKNHVAIFHEMQLSVMEAAALLKQTKALQDH